MKPDQTIKVAVAIDVRGKGNRRCGVGCWAKYYESSGDCLGALCDAFNTDDGKVIRLRMSKHYPGEYLRCRACRDAECAREATEEDLAATGFVRRQDYDAALARTAELEAEATARTRRDLAGTCPHCHKYPCECSDMQRAYKPPSNDTPERIAYASKNDLTEWVIVRRIQALIDASKSPAHRQAVDDLCVALYDLTAAEQERDAVVDRICEAVRWEGRSPQHPDRVYVGGAFVCHSCHGPALVDRIRAEIRKAAACTG